MKQIRRQDADNAFLKAKKQTQDSQTCSIFPLILI